MMLQTDQTARYGGTELADRGGIHVFDKFFSKFGPNVFVPTTWLSHRRFVASRGIVSWTSIVTEQRVPSATNPSPGYYYNGQFQTPLGYPTDRPRTGHYYVRSFAEKMAFAILSDGKLIGAGFEFPFTLDDKPAPSTPVAVHALVAHPDASPTHLAEFNPHLQLIADLARTSPSNFRDGNRDSAFGIGNRARFLHRVLEQQ